MTSSNVGEFRSQSHLRGLEALGYYFHEPKMNETKGDRKIWLGEFSDAVDADKFPQIIRAKEQTKGRDAQVSINDTAPYEIPYEDKNGSVIGRMNLRTKGIFYSKKDGTQFYQGVLKADQNADTYNFNPSDRPFLKEMAVAVIRNLGEVFGSEPYKVHVEGEVPVHKQY